MTFVQVMKVLTSSCQVHLWVRHLEGARRGCGAEQQLVNIATVFLDFRPKRFCCTFKLLVAQQMPRYFLGPCRDIREPSATKLGADNCPVFC